jgi:hypothetical protein
MMHGFGVGRISPWCVWHRSKNTYFQYLPAGTTRIADAGSPLQ